MSVLEHNVIKALPAASVVALAPTRAHDLSADDHLRGASYVVKADAPASALVFGTDMVGRLDVFRVQPRKKDASPDAVKAALVKATREIGMAARANDEPYTVSRCHDAATPWRDKAKWAPWLGQNDFVGAYVRSEGLSNEYYLVVKSDAGAAGEELSTHIKRRIAADSATYAQIARDPVTAAVESAALRNSGRIASRIAARADMQIKEMDDVRAKVVREAHEAPPRVAIATIAQPFNVLCDVPSKSGIMNKYAGYTDKTSVISPNATHVVVPVSPIEGVLIYQPAGKVSGIATMVGVPLGTGLAEPAAADAARDRLQGQARHNGQMSANLNEMFSWSGRTAGRHDNAELWRYNTAAPSNIGTLLGTETAVCALKPLHVCLPFTA